MRSIRWMSLTLLLAACSAKGGSGYSGPPADDASTADDAAATADTTSTPDVPVGTDAKVSPDVPAPTDRPAPMDVVVTPDVPVTPDIPVTPDVGPSCGDGICNGEESCSSCPRDCGACPPPVDVPVELFCGDSMCSASRGETCSSCPSDCGACPPPVDVPMTDPCAALATCSSCAAAAATGCGWCSNAGRCATGSTSGPTSTISGCSASASTWVRSTTACGGTTTGVTAACTAASTGTTRDCGWRTGSTFTCTPGRLTTIGCNSTADTTNPLCSPTLGACTGDPILRVCPGSSPCTSTTALVATNGNPDDECGTCPVVQVTCPTSGQIHVLTGDYNTSATSTQRGTCSPSVR
ncbi:MAG: hypothetical protein U0326_38255 [Polyangiales bacterium]